MPTNVWTRRLIFFFFFLAAVARSRRTIAAISVGQQRIAHGQGGRAGKIVRDASAAKSAVGLLDVHGRQSYAGRDDRRP